MSDIPHEAQMVPTKLIFILQMMTGSASLGVGLMETCLSDLLQNV